MPQPNSATTKARVVNFLTLHPGSSDREIADAVLGAGRTHQPVNAICRQLHRDGFAIRKTRQDGKLGTFPAPSMSAPSSGASAVVLQDSEDWVKAILEKKLRAEGWRAKIAFGRSRGCDITAERGQERWCIEVKGAGKHSTMRHNYFLAVWGQIAFRFSSNRRAKHSIAFPRHPGYERLWARVSPEWKERLGVSIILVSPDGLISEFK